MLSDNLKEIKELGVEVHVVINNLEGNQFNPKYMKSINQVIVRNTKPIKLNDFRKTHKDSIDLLQNMLKENQIGMVDFAVNQCWNDICEVLTPSGHPIMMD